MACCPSGEQLEVIWRDQRATVVRWAGAIPHYGSWTGLPFAVGNGMPPEPDQRLLHAALSRGRALFTREDAHRRWHLPSLSNPTKAADDSRA